MAMSLPREDRPPNLILALVAVKLPSFWMENAKVWFLQSQFEIARIAMQATMFHHVLTSLPKESSLCWLW